MDFREQNILKIAEYFRSGCKETNLLGLELEHFIVDKASGASLAYADGVEKVLQAMQPGYGEAIMSEGHIIGIMHENAVVTLEPAAQFEVSVGPVASVSGLERLYGEFFDSVRPVLEGMNCELRCVGYQPRAKVDDLKLIPKKRYEYMDAYFKTTGSHGKNMMKGSAATQVSIDYKSEADFARKFRVANSIGPLFALLCDNTRFFEGEPFKGRMARTQIWNDVDADRSMVVKGALDRDFGFYEYAEYIYDCPPILIPEGEGQRFTGSAAAAEIYKDRLLNRDEIEHLISMVFPDVRLKTYLEIRMADSMPLSYALAYTALLKGLFYNEYNLDRLYELTFGIGNEDVAAAKLALITKGFEAVVYGRRASEWMKLLYELAEKDLDEPSYLRPFEKPMLSALTVAEMEAQRV